MSQRLPPASLVYKEQLNFLCYGDALWKPTPKPDYTRINIGDVGFIHRGEFHLLFSAGSPLGQRRLGVDVPITFEQLDIGTLVSSEPRPPGCLHSLTVRRIAGDLPDTEFTPLSSKYGIDFSFDLTGDHGAALVTRYPTYREDSPLNAAFETYTKHHYESWVAFARDKQYGDNIQPILVSGVDMTKDFAMVAYSNKDAPHVPRPAFTIPMFPSNSAPFQGRWRARYFPNINLGPRVEQPMHFLPDAGSTTDEFNQCVFVRHYTMRSRWWGLFPKVIRVGTGPHDLSPGDNRGDAHWN
ncbi:hypothetical protein BDM02DRAFT_3123328 [Thelephora ganbajun]|uniref:Uncharacterized protein n=1 Tax=Thelephora ganbajun TaxID=370292 RepID=A0ACB6Z334_THEGA|nr:hypothetical protein BDM02DRAFT_3123328 [Thelephora ganbajun]